MFFVLGINELFVAFLCLDVAFVYASVRVMTTARIGLRIYIYIIAYHESSYLELHFSYVIIRSEGSRNVNVLL